MLSLRSSQQGIIECTDIKALLQKCHIIDADEKPSYIFQHCTLSLRGRKQVRAES